MPPVRQTHARKTRFRVLADPLEKGGARALGCAQPRRRSVATARDDRTTSPELERFLANRMHAKTIELDASHLSLITHPQEITDLILNAAGHSR